MTVTLFTYAIIKCNYAAGNVTANELLANEEKSLALGASEAAQKKNKYICNNQLTPSSRGKAFTWDIENVNHKL